MRTLRTLAWACRLLKEQNSDTCLSLRSVKRTECGYLPEPIKGTDCTNFPEPVKGTDCGYLPEPAVWLCELVPLWAAKACHHCPRVLLLAAGQTDRHYPLTLHPPTPKIREINMVTFHDFTYFTYFSIKVILKKVKTDYDGKENGHIWTWNLHSKLQFLTVLVQHILAQITWSILENLS